jgi:Flp pilus assembly protein TadG
MARKRDTQARVAHGTSGRMAFQGWARDTDGSMSVFALFIFFAMFLVAGVAVDAMRIEHERVRFQGASDRSVLAATMMRENISGATPEQIALAYMTAEGLGEMVQTPMTVEQRDGSRRVTIDTRARMPATFMQLLGVQETVVQTRAVAIEALGSLRLEVVLVLDVTGSMSAMTGNGLSRIQNLRNAATDLVTQLLQDRPIGEVALTIVPYAEHVLPPPGFINHFPLLPAGNGACIDFLNYNSFLDSLLQPVLRRSCQTHIWRTVRPYVSTVNEAVTVVQRLEASGTTSIDAGVRFGALFFDPSIRPAIEQMVSNNTVHPAFASHPLRHDEAGVVRAMILMTDGENCCGARFAVSAQDANTRATCDALKANRVLIYAVAFEAPQRGVELMQDCATNANYFFNTNGAGIADAFAAVATHIQTQVLRLVE